MTFGGGASESTDVALQLIASVIFCLFRFPCAGKARSDAAWVSDSRSSFIVKIIVASLFNPRLLVLVVLRYQIVADPLNVKPSQSPFSYLLVCFLVLLRLELYRSSPED